MKVHFGMRVHLESLQVIFVYQGHRVRVKTSRSIKQKKTCLCELFAGGLPSIKTIMWYIKRITSSYIAVINFLKKVWNGPIFGPLFTLLTSTLV